VGLCYVSRRRGPHTPGGGDAQRDRTSPAWRARHTPSAQCRPPFSCAPTCAAGTPQACHPSPGHPRNAVHTAPPSVLCCAVLHLALARDRRLLGSSRSTFLRRSGPRCRSAQPPRLLDTQATYSYSDIIQQVCSACIDDLKRTSNSHIYFRTNQQRGRLDKLPCISLPCSSA
jgi:hypothetical protein